MLGYQAPGPPQGTVMHGDRVSVPGEIASQVAAHDTQPGDADLRCLLIHVSHLRVLRLRLRTLSAEIRPAFWHTPCCPSEKAGYPDPVMMRLLLLRSRGEAP
jgi:hypothetical protein